MHRLFGLLLVAGVAPAFAAPPDPKAAPVELQPTKTLPIDLTDLTGFGLSPDGGTVGVNGKGKTEAGTVDSLAAFYDLGTGKRVGPPMVLSGPGAMSAGAKTTAFFDFQIGQDSDIVVREVATGKQQVVAHIENGLEFFRYSPDGTLIVTGRKAGLGFWNSPAGTPKFPLVVPPGGPIRSLSLIYKDGTRIATLHDGGKIAVWDLTTGKPADELDLKRPLGEYAYLDIAPDGKTMIVNDGKGEQAVWDLEAKKRLVWADPPKLTTLRAMTGRRVAYPTDETRYDVEKGKQAKYFVAVADADTGRVRYRCIVPGQTDFEPWRELVPSHDGKRVVSMSQEKRLLYVWDLPAEK